MLGTPGREAIVAGRTQPGPGGSTALRTGWRLDGSADRLEARRLCGQARRRRGHGAVTTARMAGSGAKGVAAKRLPALPAQVTDFVLRYPRCASQFTKCPITRTHLSRGLFESSLRVIT